MLLAGLLMLAFTAAIALFFALPAWLWARWLRRNEAPLADALTFAALWVGQEAFRGWFLTGFPWLYSGYSQLDGPLTGLAPLGGMWLISFALALTAALLCNLPRLLATPAQRLHRRWPVAAGGALGHRPGPQASRLDLTVRRPAERGGDPGQRRTKHEVGPRAAQCATGAVPRHELQLQAGRPADLAGNGGAGAQGVRRGLPGHDGQASPPTGTPR